MLKHKVVGRVYTIFFVRMAKKKCMTRAFVIQCFEFPLYYIVV